MAVKVMFTGDSVTDGGHARPVGLGLGTLGDNYVSNIFCMLYAKNPLAKISFLNSAVGGHTSDDLRARWDEEVLPYKSDYIFVMIGINDVWRTMDTLPLGLPEKMPENVKANYRKNMEEMIASALKCGSTPVLVSPYFTNPNKKDRMRALCDSLNDILKELAENYHLDYIDVQKAMDKYVSLAGTNTIVSGDCVHPKAIGKYIIANTIMASPVWKKIEKM